MNQDWQNFLAQQGAQIQEGVVQNFGDLQAELLAARDGNVVSDLSQFGTLKVAGEDAQGFLQNLLSSDVKLVSPKQAQPSSFNSPKGRMMATFLVWQNGTDYFLQVPQSLAAAMQKKLSMFVLRSKVKVTDVSGEVVSLGVSGSAVAELIKKNFGSVPEGDWAAEQHDNTSVIRIGAQRFQICTSAQQAPALWQRLLPSEGTTGHSTKPARGQVAGHPTGGGAGGGGARPAGATCWDWLNIRDGIPVITPATQEQFVLQMTNFDVLGGVSFKKGCYPGQEIVARTQYLGKLKRRMYLAHVESSSAPKAGDEVFSEEMAGQPSGMVINATPAAGGGFDVLAVLQISSRETQSVHLQSMQGAALNFLPLPYQLP